ncbi:S-layer homology domain-containing protein [Paenibacillus donghaensis]|uniref:S-layer homology domain-containing protein n=1 Tax=Paenibacillus donghaensis TaxID=414771 RepID=UPI0014718165|nr:S-layer homology domain-containing protein [Paenibacillus donghaensis]
MLNWLLIVSLIVGMIQPGPLLTGKAAAAAVDGVASIANDTTGHWAEKQLNEWMENGYIKGFQDGSFRPDQAIARIEFVTLVNRLFAYKGTADISFKDVPTKAWFASEVSAASQAGYVKGFPDGTFQPNKSLSRVEAAVMLAKLTPLLMKEGDNPLDVFKDAGSVPGYGRDALSALMVAGYMKGFPDQTVGPAKSLTRAEAVVLLDRIWEQSTSHADGGIVPPAKTLETGGTYGPATGSFMVAGDLTVNAPGTTLRNVIVKGNLVIGQKVGDGDIYLDHVTVLGSTAINGGGAHSVHIDNSQLGAVVVDRADGVVRVVIGGTTIIKQLDVQSDANIESNLNGTTSGGIEGVVISSTGEVTLSGDFNSVEIKSNVKVTVASGTIAHMVVNESATSSTITLNEGVQVTSLELHGTARVKGKGEIAKALVDAPNVVFESKPGSVETTDRGDYTVGSTSGSAGGGVAGGTGGGGTGGGGTGGDGTGGDGTGGGGTTPVDPQPQNVAVTTTLPSSSGFLLSFSDPVANLTAADISLQDTANHAVGITFVGSLNEGSSYRVAAALNEGETYSVTLSKTGYTFGTSVTFSVPVTSPDDIVVAKTVQNISAAGFGVTFDKPVTGLQTSNFTLKRSATGEAVPLNKMTPNSDGTSYHLAASLQEGVTYSLTVTKAGYNFGNAVSVFVPVTDPSVISVTAEVYGIGESGFQISLNPPVAGLTPSNFTLVEKGGRTLPIDGAVSTDDGGSYAISAILAPGSTYTLIIEHSGYSFGAALEVAVPGDLVVTPAVSDVTASGFTLSLDQPVPGLTTENFTLSGKDGQAVDIDNAATSDGGSTYTITAGLTKGETYRLNLQQAGYNFGAPLEAAVPAEEGVKVTPSVKTVRTYGFILTMDPIVPALDSLNLVLKNGAGEVVSIDMLSAVVVGKEYEVWATLDKNGTYTLSLDKEGYEFTEPITLTVQPEGVPSSVGWISHGGFQIVFQNAISSVSSDEITLEDPSGKSVAVGGVQLSAGGKSAVVSADLSAAGIYSYRVDMYDGRFAQGTVDVPALVAISKYTTYDGYPGGYTGLTIYFDVAVPGLTASAFQLKNSSGEVIAFDSVLSQGGGSSYVLQTTQINAGGPFVLGITASGYSFGDPTTLGNATLNLWNAGRKPTQFMAGLNPSVPDLTTDNFTVKDAAGHDVEITDVTWDSRQRIYVVTFDGSGGQSYSVSAKVDGYDFGAPKTIHVYSQNAIIDPSYTGFTLVMAPPVKVNTQYGFKLTRSIDGTAVPLQKIVMNDDEGSSYQISATLAPGYYNLTLDADVDPNVLSFEVPVVATLSVDTIAANGLDAKLDYALDGLDAGTFVLFNNDTGDQVDISSAVTDDQGKTYHLSAHLPGGSYNLKLTGHLPEAGVDFQVAATADAGATTLSNITNAGFDLSFDNPVLGLLPANITIKDAQNNKLSGVALSTNDHGGTYHVRVTLANNADYTVELQKDYMIFDSPVSFHVNRLITGSVADVTNDGHLTLKFAPAFPEIENYLGLSLTDEAGTVYYPNLFESVDGGASYQLYVPGNKLHSGTTYYIRLDKDEFSMNPVSFMLPPTLTVTEATTSSLKVQLDGPVPGLGKKNFILKNASGESVALTSVATDDSGAHYTLTGTFVGGQTYTVQYKPDVTYQVNDPVAFAVSKIITATISNVTVLGFKVQFSSKVAGLTPQQVILHDPSGDQIPTTGYTLKTTDRGLSYLVTLTSALPGKGYTFDLVRDEFKLASPVSFDISPTVSLNLLGTALNKIVVYISPLLPDLTKDNFSLFDSKGKKVTFTVTYQEQGSLYNIEGQFDPTETYTLQANYPGYLFGAPLTIGFKVRVNTVIYAQTQKGFKIGMSPAVPGLSASDITITDDSGNTATVQSVQATNGGGNYTVLVPLSGGKTYTVKIADKTPYTFGTFDPFKMSALSATVDRQSLTSFWLSLSSPISLSPANLNLVDDQGQSVRIESLISRDAGRSYEAYASLTAGVQYSLSFNTLGYDFGSDIPVSVQPVTTTFEGMVSGNNQAFTLRFDHAIPNLRPSDFIIQQGGFLVTFPASNVTTEDGGYSYKVEANFYGAEQYTVLPVKDGYDFGAAVVLDVPVIVSSAILRTGASYVDIGLNSAVPGLNASDFTLKDSSGQPIAISSAVTADEGGTYRIKASFIGGENYTITLDHAGYDFGEELSVDLPSAITSEIGAVNTQGITILLTSAVGGLQASSFTLLDSAGDAVAIDSVSELNGGAGYTLAADLTAGAAYTLALSAPGYDFGSPLAAAVPIPVGIAYADIQSAELTVKLEPAVPGLSAVSFKLVDAQGNSVSAASATTTDGGATYAVQAALQYGETYSLNLVKNGYDFGTGLPFTVLKPVTQSVEALSKKGFTLRLQTAVPNLKVSHILLTDSNGEAVAIDSLVTADGGLTYQAAAKLTEGAAYRLAVTAQGYDFGPSVHLDVLPMLELSATAINAYGFNLNLSKAIPGLNLAVVHLTDSSGQSITLNSTSFYDANPNTADAGKMYFVRVPLSAGQTYTIFIQDPAHPTEGPLEVVLPIVVGSQVTSADVSGIKLRLAQAGIDLLTSDVMLLTEAGDKVTVAGIVPGTDAGTYTIQALLAEGETYSLSLKKQGYDFGTAASVYVAYRVTASIASVNENGFTLSLSSPVPDLNLTLLDGSNPATLGTVSTSDYGQTYKVTVNLAYNKEFKLRVGKTGYDFGADLTVNNVSAPPQLIDASSSESGTQVILTFDKPLTSVASSSSFSVKIDSQWQSSVVSTLGADPAQIILTWSSSGRTISSTSTVSLAYTGINRVKAVNQTYLAAFDELPASNVATLLGFVSSYAYKNDAAYPAQVLHKQYGKSALETAQLLREGGFKSANLYRAILIEYVMISSEMAPILYAMDADATSIYDAYNSFKAPYASFDYLVVGQLFSAGYSASDIGPALRKFGFQSKDLMGYLKRYNVSTSEAAKILKVNFNETSDNTVLLLRSAGYDRNGIAGAVQNTYGLSNAATVVALAGGKQSASDTAAVIKDLYQADAVTSATWLSQAGYSASDVSGAIALYYSFAGADEAIEAFFGAGFSASYTYSLLRREYAQPDAAIALLNAKVSARVVAEAVKSAGDGASVIISAMLSSNYDIKEISILVNSLWVSSGTSLSDVLAQFAGSGFNVSAQATLLREQFGADIPAAIAALYPGLTQQQRNHILKYLLDGGYDPVQLADYNLKHGSDRDGLFREFRLAGRTSVQSLQSVHDATLQGGASFTLSDAIQLFYNDYNNRYEVSEVLAALRTVFAQDPNVTADATAMATVLSNSQMWDKYEIAKVLIKQMGVTMQDWVELERTNAFARFGCACDVRTVVKDTQLLFAGATLPDITVAMSVSSQYTLDMIVEGTINLYPTEGVRAKGMPYLMSALKNAGYSFEEVAAEFDSKGWTEWIAVFSKYGIAASDVTAYLKNKGLTMDQVIDQLAPYPLKDRALVLREAYGLDASAATPLLLQHTGEDQEAIARALAWAYGSDPIALWIQTLRVQGATASSVINTLSARYPSFWDAGKAGPALIQGGFSQDEVMKGLLIHASVRNNLQATIGLLQSLYGQQQVTIAQLLTAASIDSPEDGLEFLQKGGYKLPDIARALKDYYGLTAGEAAKLLTAAYPNNQSLILSGLASVYGQTLGSTVAEALQEKGITDIGGAIDYLWNAGFAPQEIAGAAKEAFNQTVGQTALLFVQKNILTDKNVLITTIAAVYGQSIEGTIHALLAQQGTTSFESAISFVYQSHFSLASSIKLAKTEYGLSAGDALQALTSSNLYRQADIVSGITDIYRTSPRDSIVDSLTASGLVTLGSAVSFLQNMKFDLNGIVRVGKEHYQLTAGETAAALIAEASYGQADIQNAVSYVYGQNLTQTTLDTLSALGITVFADAVPQLKTAGLTLSDLVLAGKTYYNLAAGEITYALLQSEAFSTTDILAAVAQYYGKPLNESLDDLLKNSGIAKINDAAPYLRWMGYTLQDVIEVSKDYYGNSSQATIDALNTLHFEDSSIIEWTVLHIYGEDSDGESAPGTPQDILQGAGITEDNAAVAYLWTAGYSLYDIIKMLKEYSGKSAADTAELLIANGSFEASAILSNLNTVYGTAFDAAMLNIFMTKGIFTSAENAALALSGSGYRMAYIAEMLKKSYGKTGAETKAILTGLGIYSADAVQSTVDQVYFSVGTSSGTLQQVLDLYGITTAEGAVSLLTKQNTPVQDILQYLKDAYNKGADEATALLAPYYKGPELGIAVTTVYYSSTNIGYLAKTIPAAYTGTPGTVAGYMKGKFTDSDIVLALKVIFNLDALGVQDAISSTVMTAERVRAAVAEVFGDDPLFAYLKRMKDQGANANDVAAELDVRGLLELAPSSYLVGTLRELGYDNASILKMRYNYYNDTRQNAGTEEEQGAELVQLGVNTPAAIVQYLRKWNLLPYKVIKIVKAGLPDAQAADIALAMREQGYDGIAIMGGLSAVGEGGDAIAGILRKLGLSAPDAMVFLNDRSSDEQLQWLISNGYTPSEYIKYRNVQSDNTIAVLKQQLGLSATDIAKLLNRYKGSLSYYAVAKALYDGGFTKVSDVAGALIETRNRPVWVLGTLVGIGGWTLQDVAQGMLDSGLISLVDLVDALQMANGGVLKETYRIIKAISTRERQQFYDSLDYVERKLLDNNEIAMIITVSAMRNANISISAVTNQLKVTEVIEPEDALKVLIVSGFNVLDSVGAVWDVYRDYIGAKIVLKMFEKAAGQYISDFKNYYKLVMTLSKIVYKLTS